jgi:hypothetical protein
LSCLSGKGFVVDYPHALEQAVGGVEPTGHILGMVGQDQIRTRSLKAQSWFPARLRCSSIQPFIAAAFTMEYSPDTL